MKLRDKEKALEVNDAHSFQGFVCGIGSYVLSLTFATLHDGSCTVECYVNVGTDVVLA